MYEHLITPAIPFLPRVPFILYSIFVTAFAVLFLLGLVAAVLQLFAKGWQHLTVGELRRDLREKIRRWQQVLGVTDFDRLFIIELPGD